MTEYTEWTTAELIALIEAPALRVDFDCWLLGDEDIELTDDVVGAGAWVELNVTSAISRTCEFTISRELAWGNARISLAALLSVDGADWTRFPLGVFLTSTPQRNVTEGTPTWVVQGYDLIQILSTPIGSSITLATGDTILAAAEALIAGLGETTAFDQTAATTVAAATTTWSFLDEEWTLINVVNAMLDQIGYTPCWVDRYGVFRSGPYRSPSDRPSVWTFNTSSSTTTVSLERSTILDYFNAPNEVLGVNTATELDVPTVGNGGLYTLTNPADGPTSIAARGRTIRRIIKGQYADAAALITAVTAELDAAKRVTTVIECKVSPNPVLGHNTVVTYIDAAIPVNAKHIVERWRLPLDGQDMEMTLRQA